MNNKQKTALILLGGLIGFLSIKAGMRKDSRLLPDDLKLKVDVITSYSIHYTKLYDLSQVQI